MDRAGLGSPRQNLFWCKNAVEIPINVRHELVAAVARDFDKILWPDKDFIVYVSSSITAL